MYTLVFIVTIIILSLFILHGHLKAIYSYWKNQNVPFIKPVPVFGSAIWTCLGKTSIGSLFYEIHQSSNAPFEGFFIFHKPWLLIRNVELIKSIFIKDFDYFGDRATVYNPRDDELASSTLFVLRNPHWRYVRSKLSPTVSPLRLKHFYPCMKNICSDLLTHISENSDEDNSVEMKTVTTRYVTDALSLFAFGVKSQSLIHENSNFFNAGKKLHSSAFIRCMQMTFYSLSPFLVKTFKMKLFEPTAAEFLRTVFWRVIKEAENNALMGGEMIQYLINLRKQENNPQFSFDGEQLVAQSVQYFVAGLDTTSLTITYSLYELSINTNIQERLRNEITSYSKNWQDISLENLNEMYYLDMVVNETLRKYPAFPFVDRCCTKDYQLPGTRITIPKGNPVCISLLGLHHDPNYYPNPQKFDPERFLKENINSRPTGCFIPFSIGPRNCIGERLAVLIVKISLISILSTFSFKLSEEESSIQFSNKTLAIAPLNDIKLKFTKIGGE